MPEFRTTLEGDPNGALWLPPGLDESEAGSASQHDCICSPVFSATRVQAQSRLRVYLNRTRVLLGKYNGERWQQGNGGHFKGVIYTIGLWKLSWMGKEVRLAMAHYHGR